MDLLNWNWSTQEIQNSYILCKTLHWSRKSILIVINKEKNRKWFQSSILIVTVFIDGNNMKSFLIGPSEQATKSDIQADISPL